MKRCNMCGLENKITIMCKSCKETICIHCFYVKLGLCADCLVFEYESKYKEKIEQYAKQKIVV